MDNNIIENSNKNVNLLNEVSEKYANTIRNLCEHENVLLNMRFSWFTTIQGLLFASLGFTWKDKSLPIICVISIMGVIVAISFISVVILHRAALKNLNSWWETNLHDYQGPPQRGFIMSDRMTLMRFFRPWRILPYTFIIAWLFILIYCIATTNF